MEENEHILLALIVISLSLAVPNGMQDKVQPNVPPNEHIWDLINTLPAGSKVRSNLESGRHGNGVDYAWMDKMREQGVKRAMVAFNFTWRSQPVDLTIDRILFFNKYDSDCGQITNSEHLLRIRSSGLQQTLEEFARKETQKSKWFYVDVKPRAKRGTSRVELADDPWIPTNPPILQPVQSSRESSLISLVALDDLAGLQAALQSGSPSSNDLDEALFSASSIDDSCIASALLKAGANPNKQNSEEKTPLMYAAGFGSAAVVRALLNGGANANIQDRAGKRAAFFAEEAGHPEIVELLQYHKRN